MPVHLSHPNRRAFMTCLGGAVASSAGLEAASGADQEADLIAILNDTHIGGSQSPQSSPPLNLQQTVAWLLGLERRPDAVVINGDLALNNGRPKDYEHLLKLLAPLREANIPVHLTLGNHDNREVFAAVMKTGGSSDELLLSKHAAVISLKRVNLFLLDTLMDPPAMQGLLGADQLAWLDRMLRVHNDRPALIFAHHNPRFGGEEKFYPAGLEDSDALLDMLVPHAHVKAYVHGHLHDRGCSRHKGIHILNTPATSFVTRPAESTTGWTLARLTDQKGEFITLTHQKDHPWNGAVEKLTWR